MSSYKRAIILVTGTSALVPVIGLATAPILAHALGVVDRGLASAATAPNLVIVGGATLGLPAALTYMLARRPYLTRRALTRAAALASALALVLIAPLYFSLDFLSDNNRFLAELIVFGIIGAFPTLIVGLLRGAAYGLQCWTAIAIERITGSVLKLAAFLSLFLAGHLSVVTAVAILVVAPIVAGAAYLPMLLKSPRLGSEMDSAIGTQLLKFGAQEWMGSVAIMLMARLSQLLVTPLSGAQQLGLLVAAITVSDVPYILTQTIREIAFGVSSANSDVERLQATSRLTLICAAVGSGLIALTLPFWVTAFFGRGFEPSVAPAWVLLLASCVAVPGLIAGAGLDAAGRPGIRSLALGLALLLNIIIIILLVPAIGALGAAIATLVSTSASTIVMTILCASEFRTSAWHFVVPRRSDLHALSTVVRGAQARLLGHPRS